MDALFLAAACMAAVNTRRLSRPRFLASCIAMSASRMSCSPRSPGSPSRTPVPAVRATAQAACINPVLQRVAEPCCDLQHGIGFLVHNEHGELIAAEAGNQVPGPGRAQP